MQVEWLLFCSVNLCLETFSLRCCCCLLELPNRACPEKHALSLSRLAVEGAYNFAKKLVSGDKFEDCCMLEVKL